MPVRRSLQPPDEAFRTEMPDPIPYFIVALDGYERKDDLHALAMEIGNAWNKEDDITLVRQAAFGCEVLLLIRPHCTELTISKSYLSKEIKLLRKLERSLATGRPIEASNKEFIKYLRSGTLVEKPYREWLDNVKNQSIGLTKAVEVLDGW
ncbi:hypothetical protein Focb16_v000057 [Fusarium oxysporum f. sp. cubense]|uniref:Uncharacterized protein n=1 Tax=Fusarium oxysporum f. sp. cubense TaxID=61366 RepID=A0A559L6X1_FUSOC|nr:hypothetical protein Focb16_v000057 [Fusarium oxysporum f. sp. cubense]